MRLDLLRAAALLVAASGAAYAGHARADELAQRESIKQATVAMMRMGDFSGLEKAAASYRKPDARTTSGLWKLTLFYAGAETLFAGSADSSVWAESDRFMAAWRAAYPTSPTPYLMNARMLLSHAWAYRGYGYARTVKPENWAPFHEYVQKAREYLEDHKEVASTDPYWYELMALIGIAQGWPEAEFARHIDEGLDREPRFYQTYFLAIEYYAPKWHGTPLAIERFAKRAVRRTKATEGYGMYARIYWYASQSQFDERLFTDSVVDWQMMKQGIDDVLKTYPDDWNLNNFARFACLAEDKAKATELIGRIRSTPIAEVWQKPTFEECKVWTERPEPSVPDA